jgi:hypothetical protein
MSSYKIARDDLPGELQPVDALDRVDKIIEYQSPYADYSILLTEYGTKQRIRVYWLKHLRDEWEWVDGTDDGVGFVLLKERNR